MGAGGTAVARSSSASKKENPVATIARKKEARGYSVQLYQFMGGMIAGLLPEVYRFPGQLCCQLVWVKEPCKPKITNMSNHVIVKKNIAWLQITVNNWTWLVLILVMKPQSASVVASS
uniref:Uncharacterized protein n=1 Tax=Oryza rufipogon TaxID=4529 RepID=A0A0E0NBP5_ORYRU